MLKGYFLGIPRQKLEIKQYIVTHRDDKIHYRRKINYYNESNSVCTLNNLHIAHKDVA